MTKQWTQEDHFHEIMKDPEMVKKVFNDLFSERIKEVTATATTSAATKEVSETGKVPSIINNHPITTMPSCRGINTGMVNEIKSPSDTTIYVPAVRKDYSVGLPVTIDRNIDKQVDNPRPDMIGKISDFVESIRLENDMRRVVQGNGTEVDTSLVEDNRMVQQQQPNRASEVAPVTPALEAARIKTQRSVLEAEKFKANVMAPTGNVEQIINENFVLSEDDHAAPVIE